MGATGDQVGHNWRYLAIDGYRPIPTESMRMLSKPTLFEISESGKVSSVRMSEEEAEWSINFKKALVALFQTGVGEASGARPMSSWKQSPYSLASGSCGSLWSRSSVTRYAVCGSPDRFLIQSIINEGEVNQHLMDYKTEKMLTGTRQSIKLLSKHSSSVSV